MKTACEFQHLAAVYSTNGKIHHVKSWTESGLGRKNPEWDITTKDVCSVGFGYFTSMRDQMNFLLD